MSRLMGVIIVKFGHGTRCYSPKKQYNDKVKRHAARYPVKLRQEHKCPGSHKSFGGDTGMWTDQDRSAYDWPTGEVTPKTNKVRPTDYVAKFQMLHFSRSPLCIIYLGPG